MAFTLYKEIKYALDGIPDANLSNFPKLFVIGGDTDIAAECASGGGIQVKSADGSTTLPIELVDSLTDLTSGDVAFFVKLSPLTAASVGDVFCRLYYDGGETTTEDIANVWDANFVGVYHLEEDPSGGTDAVLDSTANANHGTSGGSMTSGDLIAAQVGNGLDFDGSNDRVLFGDPLAFHASNPFTIEMLLKTSSTSAGLVAVQGQSSGNFDGCGIVGNQDNSGATTSGAIRIYFRNASTFFIGAHVTSTGFNDGNTHHLAFSYSGSGSPSGLSVVKDGAGLSETTTGGSIIGDFAVSEEFSIAAFNDGTTALAALYDEVRLSNVVRSADWIAYTYQDLLGNADTFTLGAEQGGGGGGSIVPLVMQLAS